MIALLTDFGLSDTYVGVMKAICLRLAPGVPLVDLTHDVPPQDVASGAWALWTAHPYLPPDTIELAVVDPGVGTSRRPVAIQFASGRIFVGPDNGLATRILASDPPIHAIVLDRPIYWLDAPYRPPGSDPIATFHGRDIFSPVAARLAQGLPFAEAGSSFNPAELVRLDLPAAVQEGEVIQAPIVAVDRFGNLITAIGPDLIPALFAAPQIHAEVGQQIVSERAATFGAGPEAIPFWYRDSSGYAAIAVRDGNAAQALGVGVGAIVRVRFSRQAANQE